MAGQPRSSEDVIGNAFVDFVALLLLGLILTPTPKKTPLSLGDLDRRGTLGIVVDGSINPRIHWKAVHQPSIKRLQVLRNNVDICPRRIEPFLVVLRIENHRHSVVKRRSDCVPIGCQDRTGFQGLSTRILPGFPQSSKREQLTAIDLKTIWMVP